MTWDEVASLAHTRFEGSPIYFGLIAELIRPPVFGYPTGAGMALWWNQATCVHLSFGFDLRAELYSQSCSSFQGSFHDLLSHLLKAGLGYPSRSRYDREDPV